MPQRLDILDRLHKRLLDIIASGLPLITSSVRDADMVGLVYLRSEMLVTIEAYAQHIQQLSDAAHVSGDLAREQAAQELKIGCIALQQTYRAFTDRWRHRDGISNWPEYRLSAIVMMKQVRNHIRAAAEPAVEVAHERSSPRSVRGDTAGRPETEPAEG